MSRVFFVIGGLAAIGLMHFGLWWWLVRATQLPPRRRKAATAALMVLGGVAPLGVVALMMVRSPASQLFAVAVFSWLALALMLVSVLVVVNLPLAIYARVAKVDPGRRRFIARAVASGATLATAGAGVFALRSATGPAQITEVPVKLARLPPQLSGFTIAQITDLHVGPTIGEREVRRVVEQCNALKPDLVAVTGDLVDGSVAQLGRAVGELARLQSRHGTYFVTGNHEHYSGVDEWVAELKRLGLRVLRNERVTVGPDASFDLAGVDDYGGGGAPAESLAKALEGRDAQRGLVLLAHQPKAVAEAVAAGVELQISGHTHGGQIVPFNLVVGAVFPYLAGLYRHEAGQVFVSRGTGYWGPPMRFGSPPEIAKLVLTA